MKTNRFYVGFPVGRFLITCIAKKYLNNSSCDGSVHIDTMKKVITSVKNFSYLDGVFEGTSTEHGNKVFRYYQRDVIINGSSDLRIKNFGMYDSTVWKKYHYRPLKCKPIKTTS